MAWLKGTRDGKPTFTSTDPLSRGRSLFVERQNGAWTAYSARAWLDAPGESVSAKDAAWCDTVVFVASGGNGRAYFDTW